MGKAAQRKIKKSREYPHCFWAQRSAAGKKPSALQQEGLLASGNSQKPSVGPSGLVMGKPSFPWNPMETSCKMIPLRRHFSNITKSEIYWALENVACVQHIIIQTPLSQITMYLVVRWGVKLYLSLFYTYSFTLSFFLDWKIKLGLE